MNLRTLSLTVPLAVVLACGGSASTGSGSAALDAATPRFATLALDQIAADTTAPAALLAAPDTALVAQMAGPGGGCHPHLFMREREVVERVNRHIYKVLRLVEKVIATNPVSETEKSKTWTASESGADFSFTVRLVGSSMYSWELAAAPTGTAPLRVVMSGEIDRNGYTGEHEGKGTMEVDFALLHAAFPNERAASGTLEVRFDVSAAARKIAVRGTDVTWDIDVSKFDGGIVPAALSAPRSGEYVYYRVPEKGGSLKIKDEMVFLCGMDPRTANVALVPADTRMVSRWYRSSDGRVHGRSDGLITGGNLVAPVDRIVGVTCHDAAADRHMPTEGYWLMKAEDASGATLVGFDATSMMDTAAVPCDPQLGEVPLLADPSKDFKDWPESYFDDPPFPFPGTPFPGP
jgi:hypothetical protein